MNSFTDKPDHMILSKFHLLISLSLSDMVVA